MEKRPGAKVDRRYEIVQALGEGSSGCVYLARDTLQEGRLVALKELREAEPETLEYFTAEFALLSALRHPGLVETYDYGHPEDGAPYFTMEYVPGGDLAARRRPLPLEDCSAIVTALLEALTCLHDAGCVHFDLKPSNVLLSGRPLGEPGAVKLADFGLSGGPGLYQGGLRGTPHFAAPELIRGERADGRADLYSLGALLYWMLAGHPPFPGPRTSDLLRQHLEEAPVPPRQHRPELPEALDLFTLRLLAKNPASRYETSRAAAQAWSSCTGTALPAGTPPQRAPFVGRARELEELLAAVEGLTSPTPGELPGLLLLCGEPGVGKSRLADEFRVLCQTRDVPFLATSVSAEGRAPMAGLQALLPQLRALAGERLVPPDAGASVVEVTARVAATTGRPFVLFLDDLEGADAPTVDALRALARSALSMRLPFLLLGALRTDAPGNRKLEETLFLLRSEGVARDLPLGPLQEREVRELVTSLVGSAGSASQLARRIMREVGGLPLVVTTAIEFLASSPGLTAGTDLTDAFLLSGEHSSAGIPLPESIQTAVLERRDRLPPATQRLAVLIATSRTPLSTHTLAELLELPADSPQLAVALEQARGAHLIRPLGDPDHPLWAVASAVVHQVLLRTLSEDERRELHGRLAAHLERTDAPMAEIAYHAVRGGGDPRQAASTAAAAGRHFLQLEDHTRAREFLEAAVRCEEDEACRARVALDLASALQVIGDQQALRRTLELVNRSHVQREELVRWHLLVGEAEMAAGKVDEARAAFEAAARDATGEELAGAHTRLAILSMRRGKMEEFQHHSNQVFELAERTGDPEHQAQALMVRGHYHRVTGEMERAGADYERSVELLAPRGPSALLRQAYHHLAWLCGFRGDDERAMEYYRRSNSVAAATGVIGDLARSHRGMGLLHQSRGETDAAERHLRRALEIIERFGGTDRGYILLGLGKVHLDRAEYRDSQRLLGEAREDAMRDQHEGLLAEVTLLQAVLSLRMGDGQAARLAEEAHSFFERFGDHISWESRLIQGEALAAASAPEALEVIREATGRAERAGRLEVRSRCLAALVQVLPPGEERIERVRELVQLARAGHERRDTILASEALGLLTRESTEHTFTLADEQIIAIDEQLQAGLAVARALPDPEAVWKLEAYLGSRHLVRGNLRRAGQHLRLAYTTLEELWRQLPEGHRARYLRGTDPDWLAAVIQRYNEAVQAATVEAATPEGGTHIPFALEEPAPLPATAPLEGARAEPATLESSQPRRRLAVFYEISRRIGAIRDRDQLLAEVLNLALEELDADRGIVFLATGEEDQLIPTVRRDLEAAATREAGQYSRQAVQRAAAGQAAVLITDAMTETRDQPDATAPRLGITSLMCVPLRSPSRLVGTIYVDSRRASRRFLESDLEFLSAFGDLAAVAIENAEHYASQEEELRRLREQVAREGELEQLVGTSPAWRHAVALARRAAQSEAPVLILGETGTGKELLARSIHAGSRRRDGPFVVVDCTTLPPSLAENELFGHVAGAFTDARESRDGLLVLAHQGTLFIDEIGELPLELQGALLRFLQEGEVRPVGASAYRQVSTRVICATHRDLEEMVALGSLRPDLYYRLNVITVQLPPLRERREDIPLLVEHLLERIASREGRRLRVTAPAVNLLTRQRWSGNVRQLENVLRSGAVLARDGIIDVQCLDLTPEGTGALAPGNVRDPVEERRAHLEEVLRQTAGSPRKAAALLGVSVRTLYRRLERLGLRARDYRP